MSRRVSGHGRDYAQHDCARHPSVSRKGGEAIRRAMPTSVMPPHTIRRKAGDRPAAL